MEIQGRFVLPVPSTVSPLDHPLHSFTYKKRMAINPRLVKHCPHPYTRRSLIVAPTATLWKRQNNRFSWQGCFGVQSVCLSFPPSVNIDDFPATVTAHKISPHAMDVAQYCTYRPATLAARHFPHTHDVFCCDLRDWRAECSGAVNITGKYCKEHHVTIKPQCPPHCLSVCLLRDPSLSRFETLTG